MQPLIFGFLLVGLGYAAQEKSSLRFERYSTEEGLSQLSIICMMQDRQGFMWFGTQTGLNRFDGYSFRHFTNVPGDPHSISHNYILSIAEDGEGNIWIGTRGGGLNRFSPESQRFEVFRHHRNNPQSLSHDEIHAIAVDSHGVIWMGTKNGLTGFNPVTRRFDVFRHQKGDPRSLSHNTVHALGLDRHGILWVGTDNGLNRFDPLTRQFLVFRHETHGSRSLGQNSIKTILLDTHDTLWVGTRGGGLNRYGLKTGLFETYRHESGNPHSLSDNEINAIVSNRNGILWIGTESGGLNRFDPQTRRFEAFRHVEGDPHSISDNRVVSVAEDRQGNLWIGTWNAGLNRFDPQTQRFGSFRHEPGKPNSLSQNFAYAITGDRGGALWIGTLDGLNHFDPQTGRFEVFRNQSKNPGSLSHNKVKALTVDRQGILWIGTYGGGLNRFDAHSRHFEAFRKDKDDSHSLSNDDISTIEEDRHGVLWIGTQGGGVNRFDPKTRRFEIFNHNESDPHSLSNDDVLAIVEDRNGILWIGTASGLNRFDPETRRFEVFRHDESDPHSLGGNWITSLAISSLGELWIGTKNAGLNRLVLQADGPLRFTKFTTEDGLAANAIGGILEDRRQLLWVSTVRGISRIDPKTGVIKNFDEKDGLQSSGYWIGSYYKDREGIFYFGGTKGITFFNPERIINDLVQPKVVLTAFRLFNRETLPTEPNSPMKTAIEATRHITLDHRQNLFSIEFAALHFAQPTKNRYAYRLEGFDEDWIHTDAKHRIATYSNLPGGDYQFQVKAANKDGIWSAKPASMNLTILPPPWKTWWAYSIYSLAALALLGAFVWTQRRKVAYERALNDSLRQVDQLKDHFLANTSHELRTPLNGIIGLAESLVDGAKGTLPTAVKNDLTMLITSGRCLSTLVNDILDFSKIKSRSFDLDLKSVDLKSLIDVVITMSKLLGSKKPVELINAVPPDCTVRADGNRLQQILFNLIGNAIKFTDRGFIKIKARTVDDTVRVAIADTGIGIPREKHQQIFETFEQAEGATDRLHGGTGLGLAITKQLVELHGGTIWVESEIGKGSTFFFTLVSSSEEGEEITPPAHRQLDVFNEDATEPGPVTRKSGEFKILIVDDEPINLRVLKNHLSNQPYSLVEATNGPEALKLLDQQSDIDLVLLDIMMPRMSGYEVCQEIRKTKASHQLPVIYLSAKNQTGDLAQGFESGANDYLIKPISRVELLARVQNHLQLFDANRNLEQKIRERTREIELLANIGREITANLDFGRIVDLLYARLTPMMDTHEFGVGLYNRAQRQITFIHYVFNGQKIPDHIISTTNPNRLSVQCVLNNKEIVLGDIDREYSKYVSKLEGYRKDDLLKSLLCFPLTSPQKGVIGLISVQSHHKHAYKHRQVALLRSLAASTAIALENTMAYEAIREKKEEIRRAQTQLIQAEKMAGLGSLAAGVAHEINNPTNFVNAGTYNLRETLKRFKDYLFDLVDEEAGEELTQAFGAKFVEMFEQLETIHNGAQRIHSIVKDLRTFSRLDEAEMKTVNLHEGIRSTLNLVKTQFGDKIEFVTHMEGELMMECWAAELNQVFMNMLINGCQAILSKTYADHDQGRMVVETRILGERARVVFRDNGCGMTPEIQARAFEPFYTTKTLNEGTGLGLSISYGIIKKHHGTIEMSSRTGEGTEFVIELPLHPDDVGDESREEEGSQHRMETPLLNS
ncbi:Response regulator [Sulfidibacter corallicola]|uniref:histidine kinase n=1 Tax=Sulfidibacter corallicola TaxID=2818388 RepID=A0A8A4TL11_SULCO|nr:two-component regulator propeller domain-containing protein [Sulfidibacter corallicola]QTD50230.1 response regulator [Sulfidibacter corallicola]